MARPIGEHPRQTALVALMVAGMAASTLLQGGISVLSSFIIDEFGLSRSQLGLVFTVFAVAGAGLAPAIGIFADKGGHRAIQAIFAFCSMGIVVAALAPNYLLLLVGVVLGGLALGAGNPGTNQIVSQRVPPSRRALVIGLKQAGSPLALMTVGLLLPPLALAFNWRVALLASAAVPVAALIATPWILGGPSSGKTTTFNHSDAESSRALVLWLTAVGAIVAMGIASVIAFLPLYAQEEMGFSASTAGSLAATLGFTGLFARVLWGSLGGRLTEPSSALLTMSGVSIASIACIAIGPTYGVIWVWVGTIGMGVSMQAWHSMAWLMIINGVGTGGIGKASGVMQLGNGLGFAAGPPIVGSLIDVSGSYRLSWLLVGVLFGATFVMTLGLRRQTRQR